MSTEEIEITHGRTQDYLLTITDDEGDPVILADGTLVFTARELWNSTEALFTKEEGDGITYSVEIGEENVATLTIDADDLADLPNDWHTLSYDVTFWRPGLGGQTPIRGAVRVTPGIGVEP